MKTLSSALGARGSAREGSLAKYASKDPSAVHELLRSLLRTCKPMKEEVSLTRRLVCISNGIQLPTKAASAGGLTVGVLSALKRQGGMWFGWSGELSDCGSAAAKIQSRDSITYGTIDLPRDLFERYYNGFANDALWPLFHYMPHNLRFRVEDWEAYQSVNERFASAVQPLLAPNDLVWVHDYHLIPLARHLRAQGARQLIGFFLHIPFPHHEVLRVLPRHRELLRELLQFDLLGFQTEGDMACFRGCIERVFGSECTLLNDCLITEGRRVGTAVFPIGVDVERLTEHADRARKSETVQRMIGSLQGRRLMLGVDRLDYSKGLVERFAAYERFLETYPQYRGQITYLQVAPLSRKHVQSYVDIRRTLEQATGRTNGKFGDADWTPIRYINRNVARETLMGFMRAARVGLVTPLRDGMNLVAKEYLAAQDPTDPGVLVLSELAGAASELRESLLVNPYDIAAVGRAVQTALEMPLAERRERHAALLVKLRRNDVERWALRFVQMLARGREAAIEPPDVAVLGS